MKRKLLMLFIGCLLCTQPNSVSGNGFEIWFGGPGTQICTGMAVGSDSSIYMLGYTYNGTLGGTDYMLAKVNLQGQLQWTQYFGTSHDDFGASVVFTSGGHLLLAGTSHDPQFNEQVLIIIADTAGNQISSHFFGASGIEGVNAVSNCPDNGYLVSGYQSNGTVNYAYVLKLDSLINEEWSGSYGTGINDYASEALMTSENSFFLAYDRRFNTGGGNFDYDVGILKTDSLGLVAWDSVYHADFQNGGQGLIQSQSGHLLIFGETEISQFSPFDYFILAADTNGNLLWRQTFGGSGTNAMFDLIEDPNGDLVGTGYGNSQSGGIDPINVVVVKTDAAGNLIWQREYGLPSIDLGYIIRHAPDGGYLIAGRTTSQNDEDFYLLKTDQDGMITSGPDHHTVYHPAIVFPNPGNGKFTIRASENFTTVKLFDLSGKLLKSMNASSNAGEDVLLDASALQKGIYLVQLWDESRAVFSTLVTIQ